MNYDNIVIMTLQRQNQISFFTPSITSFNLPTSCPPAVAKVFCPPPPPLINGPAISLINFPASRFLAPTTVSLIPMATKAFPPIFVIVTFIITAVSNGANLTDGLDGLAAGVSAIIGAALGVFIYVSGNYVFADYLNVMYIPNLGELSIFVGAFVGACIGFLWYNAYPAQVFMGDTGSLALGGIIASLAIIVRKELLIPIFCGVFLIENLSVIIQLSYFKYTRKKYGEGRRVFLMSPLHHHYQKKGFHESKIAVRFWIITILLVVVSILTLKTR